MSRGGGRQPLHELRHSRPSTGLHPPPADETVLFAALQQHWSAFVADVAAAAKPPALPALVVADRDARLRVVAAGRVCLQEEWSGFCPSNIGRRIADLAAHLVDRVVPFVPVRQWVLTVPLARGWRPGSPLLETAPKGPVLS